MNKTIEINPGENILISRTDKLGDLVLAVPFVESMKKRYPECRVDVLASLYASPILENNKLIDRIVRVQNDQLFKDPLYKKDLFQKIKGGNYKVVVALYPERHVSQLFYKASIPYRIGTARRFHSVFFNYHIFHSRKENEKHECEYNLDFLEFFREGDVSTAPQVYPTEKEYRNARRILTEVGIERDFIVLHPGSGGSAERWPLEKFLNLYKILVDSGLTVIISGSDQERTTINEMAERLDVQVKQIAGETDLRTLAAVLSLSNIVVANSTGPLHLAVAVSTKVVGLYPGKQIMSPIRWGPMGNNHRVLQPTNGVCHCPPKQCQCMNSIDEREVADNVIGLYQSRVGVN